MADLDLPPAAARANPHAPCTAPERDQAPCIRDFKLNGTSPFRNHANSADQRIEEAHALLLTLSAAFASADDAKERTPGEVRPTIVAQALQGVATLVALAQHHTDVHAFETHRNAAAGSVQ